MASASYPPLVPEWVSPLPWGDGWQPWLMDSQRNAVDVYTSKNIKVLKSKPSKTKFVFQKCFSPAKQFLHVTDSFALWCSVGRVGLSVSRIHASVWNASSFQQISNRIRTLPKLFKLAWELPYIGWFLRISCENSKFWRSCVTQNCFKGSNIYHFVHPFCLFPFCGALLHRLAHQHTWR